MAKYNVTIGKSFEVHSCEVADEKSLEALAEVVERVDNSKTRNRLTYVAVLVICITLLVSAATGFFDGSYDELDVVWKASAMPLGCIFGYYFSKKG